MATDVWRLYQDIFGKRILFVDDEQPVKPGMIRFVGSRFVSHVTSGMDALTAIYRQPPDIILLDTSLPDMSWSQVVRALRQNRLTKSALIVAMTSKPWQRSECLAAGCDDCILKPFGKTKLLDRLCTLVEAQAAVSRS